MKKNIWLAVFVVCMIMSGLFLLYGCGNASGGGGGGGGGSSVSASGVIWGRVLKTDGASLESVAVTGEGITGSTNQDGFFTLSGVAPGSNILVDFSKSGFIATQKAVNLATTGATYITVYMGEYSTSEPVTALSGGTVSSSDGASLTINPGTLPSDGIAYIQYFDPTVTSELGSFPGAFIGTVGGVDSPLETFGFVAIEVLDGSGNKINLLPGATAEVHIPCAATAPATIELWSYNDSTGKWDFEGIATREGTDLFYTAIITHFSWWNADSPFTCAYIKGNVVNESGGAVEGAVVYASGVTYEGIQEVMTDQYGSFEGLPVKYGELANVHAQKGKNSSGISTISSINETKPGDDIGTLVISEESIATIVLTWNELPYDLDSHLTGPTMEGDTVRFHAYFGGKNPAGADAWLDTDDTTSYGPEVVTISRWHPGSYRYCVHNWSGESGGGYGSGPIAGSGAVVTFVSTAGTRIYNVPPSNTNGYNTWRVFEVTVNSSGHITNVTDLNDFVDAANGDNTIYGAPGNKSVLDVKKETGK